MWSVLSSQGFIISILNLISNISRITIWHSFKVYKKAFGLHTYFEARLSQNRIKIVKCFFIWGRLRRYRMFNKMCWLLLLIPQNNPICLFPWLDNYVIQLMDNILIIEIIITNPKYDKIMQNNWLCLNLNH